MMEISEMKSMLECEVPRAKSSKVFLPLEWGVQGKWAVLPPDKQTFWRIFATWH